MCRYEEDDIFDLSIKPSECDTWDEVFDLEAFQTAMGYDNCLWVSISRVTIPIEKLVRTECEACSRGVMYPLETCPSVC